MTGVDSCMVDKKVKTIISLKTSQQIKLLDRESSTFISQFTRNNSCQGKLQFFKETEALASNFCTWVAQLFDFTSH